MITVPHTTNGKVNLQFHQLIHTIDNINIAKQSNSQYISQKQKRKVKGLKNS